MFFVMSLRLSDHKVASSSSFSVFAQVFSLFSFGFPNFWSSRNLIKQLFHTRLLDMRLVIGNSALRVALATYPRRAHGSFEEIGLPVVTLRAASNRGSEHSKLPHLITHKHGEKLIRTTSNCDHDTAKGERQTGQAQ